MTDGGRLGDLIALEGGHIVARRPHVAWLTVEENGEVKLTLMKVAKEVAVAEFSRMCAANRIDEDESALDKDELKEWLDIRGTIERDICRGKLLIDTEGRPVWTTVEGKALTFKGATAATFMALETHGKGKDVSNTMAAIADMTGAGKGELSKLPATDFHGCNRIAQLFLAPR